MRTSLSLLLLATLVLFVTADYEKAYIDTINSLVKTLHDQEVLKTETINTVKNVILLQKPKTKKKSGNHSNSVIALLTKIVNMRNRGAVVNKNGEKKQKLTVTGGETQYHTDTFRNTYKLSKRQDLVGLLKGMMKSKMAKEKERKANWQKQHEAGIWDEEGTSNTVETKNKEDEEKKEFELLDSLYDKLKSAERSIIKKKDEETKRSTRMKILDRLEEVLKQDQKE